MLLDLQPQFYINRSCNWICKTHEKINTVKTLSPSLAQAPVHHTNKAALFTSPRTSFLGKASIKATTVSSLTSGPMMRQEKIYRYKMIYLSHARRACEYQEAIDIVYSRLCRFQGM